jgi:4-hydroxy-tetrahydrodipicolinate synthase
MMDKQQIRQHLTGPIPSMRTPFLENGDVDYDGVRRQVDRAIEGPGHSIMLTVGDSHYDILSEEEIAEVTRVTCKRADGKILVIAADRYLDTRRAIGFAEFARDTGADVVMCLPPDWAHSCTTQTLAEHYAEVSRVMPVMIVTNRFIPRGMEFGLETIERALDLSDAVVAVKDDMCGEFARRLCLLAHERCAVFAGGLKQNHMNMYPYGCVGYLSTFATLKPDVARQYWTAIEAEDLVEARRVIREYDIPVFDHIRKHPSGFNSGLHGILELVGLAGRWRRKPYYSLNDEEMEQLRDVLKTIGIL